MNNSTAASNNMSLQRRPSKKLQFLTETKVFEEQVKKEGMQSLNFVLNFISCLSLILTFVRFYFVYEHSIQHPTKLIYPVVIAAFTQVIKQYLKYDTRFLKYLPTILMLAAIITTTENQIVRSSEKFVIHECLAAYSLIHEYLHLIIQNRFEMKICSSIILWMYYLIRVIVHYKRIPEECYIMIALILTFNILLARIYEEFFQKILYIYQIKEQIANEIFEDTLETIPQGIVVIDTKGYEVQYQNQEFNNKLLPADYSDAMTFLQSLHLNEKSQDPSQSVSVLNLDQEADEKDQVKEKISFVKYAKDSQLQKKSNNDAIFKRKEPKLQYFQVKSQIINKGSQILAVFNDITRIKELESITYKMKSMFFSSIAHELRTPLNTIIPMSQKLHTLIQDQQCQMYIKIITSSSVHLQNIIEDALDMSRIENNKFEVNLDIFNIRQSIEEVSSIMQFQIEQKKLEYEVHISRNVPELIKTDQKRYKQILFNLIGNAIKFTFKGFVKVSVDFLNNRLTTEISDSGIGIARDDQTKLFKFFGSLQNSKKLNKGGMGLGLTISKLILQELKGDISLISEFNKGSKFQFFLPVDQFKRFGTQHIQRKSFQSIYNQNQQQNLKRGSVQQQFNLKNLLIPRRDSSFESLPSSNDTEEDIQELLSIKFERLSQTTRKPLIQLSKAPLISMQSPLLRQQQLEEIKEGDSNEYTDTQQKDQIVLLVDDSPYNLFVMEELLKQIESITDIQTAMNGYDAIEKILSLSDKGQTFDIIFLDLHMPVLDGFSTMEKLRELNEDGKIVFSKTRVIAVSAITSKQFYETKNSQLFHEFMEKPVSFQKLKDVVNQWN